MHRRSFLTAGAGVLAAPAQGAEQPPAPQQMLPGVWRFRIGTPENITPVSQRHYPAQRAGFNGLPAVGSCPVAVTGSASDRGVLVQVPLEANEVVYGLGLQLQSFIQRGLKKRLRVNADPKLDTGDSHAPVPFYVTTRGYGILVDTARYAVFYGGGKKRKSRGAAAKTAPGTAVVADALPAAYRRFRFNERSEVLIEVPEAEGVVVYVFAGPTMREAVQRYNLFSGGGALPPRWGLGNWYRCDKDFKQEDVLRMAADLRRNKIPCDVLGLEPGWQTHAYSCSFVWSDKFPDPSQMLVALGQDHFRLNLWEHAFTHPSSPIYDALYPLSGDYEVWGGVVPDFNNPKARKVFADFHEKEHVARGVSGYKLDECDSSDYTGNWSFPEISLFPSGADGEQMHCLFGRRYQDAIQGIFEKRGARTYGLVRSSHALAAPYPYVLYSDLYEHSDFIRGVVNMGFSGLLWTPEVRHATSPEDLIRRMQTVALSPMALINAWYIKNPPWKQVNREANNAGKFAANWQELEAACRRIMELRMQMVPYLHAAFARYYRDGLPPFRALVMDYPADAATWGIDNQYMMGESLLVAPVTAGQKARPVYLPEGDWYDFWSGKRHAGKRQIEVAAPLEQIPLFVKGGTLLPLAQATLHTEDPASWRVSVQVYGNAAASANLIEEDGGMHPDFTEVRLAWDAGRRAGSVTRSGSARPRYEIAGWKLFE